jgi:hypothetical protein
MTDAETRQDLLDGIAAAIDQLGIALAQYGAAYELLDERSQDRLEEELFGPVQKAYGRAKRTYTGFATRFSLTARDFEQPGTSSGSRDVRRFLERAVEAVDEAEQEFIDLQDSMLPVEYGDAELRAGLSDVRALVAHVHSNARQFIRTLGR